MLKNENLESDEVRRELKSLKVTTCLDKPVELEKLSRTLKDALVNNTPTHETSNLSTYS